MFKKSTNENIADKEAAMSARSKDKVKRGLLKGVKIFGISLLALIIIASSVVACMIFHPMPKTSGTLKVVGLKADVTVIRDEYDIPNIYAENDYDLFFAQGFVTAQDRLFQMEVNRRLANGTLSEVVGAAGLSNDMASRTYGLRAIAEKSYPNLDDETKAILDAYCDGINAYIDENKLPLEFTLLGFKPSKWEPLDVMAFGNAMAQLNALNVAYELYYTQACAKMGVEMAADECPPWDNDNPEIVTKELEEYSWRKTTTAKAGIQGQTQDANSQTNTTEVTQTGKSINVLELLQTNYDSGNNDWFKNVDLSAMNNNGNGLLSGLQQSSFASGTWAVSGEYTDTGKPILACDVHMAMYIPSFWYEIGLHGGSYDVSGFSLPGAPLIMLGRNKDISWGFVNLNADVADLYTETLNDKENPTQYLYQGNWYDLEKREEVIKVKGQEPITLEYLITRHGPIVNEGFSLKVTEEQLENGPYEYKHWEGEEPLSMRWAVSDGCYVIYAMSLMNKARNWEEFREACSNWDALGESFIYADNEGNIGYQAACKIPIRTEGHLGIMPVSGSDGQYEWQGYIPFEELPSLYNPPTGYVAAVNNKTTTDDYPYLLSYDWWHPGYRARVVVEELEKMIASDKKITAEDLKTLQNDTYSYAAAQMNEYIKTVVPDTELEAKALEYVKSWDGRHDLDSVGATIYTTWEEYMENNTFTDDTVYNKVFGFDFPLKRIQSLVKILKDPNNKWFDDPNTADVIETRDEQVKKSYKQAIEYLSGKLGNDPSKWELRQLQTCTLDHTLFAGVKFVGELYRSKTVEFAGSPVSVAFAWSWSMPPNDINIMFGSTQKHIVSHDNLDNMQTVIASGESGNLFSKHRQDQLEIWAKGELHPRAVTRDAVEKAGKHTLVLKPEK